LNRKFCFIGEFEKANSLFGFGHFLAMALTSFTFSFTLVLVFKLAGW